jgi:hypothetical protein
MDSKNADYTDFPRKERRNLNAVFGGKPPCFQAQTFPLSKSELIMIPYPIPIPNLKKIF